MARKKGQGIEYEREGEEYFAERELQGGVAGWVLLAGLGVAYVISGDFAGWNFGLAEGGWGGLLVATSSWARCTSSWSSGWPSCPPRSPRPVAATPSPAAPSGPWGGFPPARRSSSSTPIAPAAIANFISAYVDSLVILASRPSPVFLVFYALFVGLHIYGVGEALKLMFAITAIAVVALLAFVVAAP